MKHEKCKSDIRKIQKSSGTEPINEGDILTSRKNRDVLSTIPPM